MRSLGKVEIVRYKAIVEEIFQAWIPKERISTRVGPQPNSGLSDIVVQMFIPLSMNPQAAFQAGVRTRLFLEKTYATIFQ